MRAHPLRPVVALGAAVLFGGCFNPKLEPGFVCGADPPGPECPSGFFCDQVTYTCLRDGTPATKPGVTLGAALPNLSAARLGDGVVVAGWFLDQSQNAHFQVLRFNNDGSSMYPPSPQPTLDSASQAQTGVKAAGTRDVAVITGIVSGSPDHLARLWVSASSAAIDAGDEGEVSTHAVASSASRACFVRTYPGTAGIKSAALVCNDGTTMSAPWQVSFAVTKPFTWASASVTDNPDDDMVLVESAGVIDTDGAKNQILAFCAGHAAPTPIDRALPATGYNLLRPHVARAPDGSAVWAGWATSDGLFIDSIDADCNKGTAALALANTSRFAATSGAANGAAAGIKGVTLSGNPLVPTAEDWLNPGVTHNIVMDPAHSYLANPAAVTDGQHDFWFLFYASDTDEKQGWIKGVGWNTITESVTAVASDSGTVASDFTAVPRAEGGFYLVFRDNPDGVDVTQPLTAYLAVVLPDLTVLRPPAQ